MRLADLPVPTTAAATLVAEVVAEYSAPALVNHCVRSYLFAAALGRLENVRVDDELLYVAALLHDLGLEPAFDSHRLPFEQAGGEVAWVFAAGAGWALPRRRRAAEIVVAHMRDVAASDDPEGYLLSAATGLDITGTAPQRWPEQLRREVVAAHPRLDLVARFTACFADQAQRKPDSAAGRSVRAGITARLAANPLESL